MLPLPRLRDPVWFPVSPASYQEQSLIEQERALEAQMQAIATVEPIKPNIGFPREAPEDLKVLANDTLSRDPTDPYLSTDIEIEEDST